jgi:hypothetical protein
MGGARESRSASFSSRQSEDSAGSRHGSSKCDVDEEQFALTLNIDPCITLQSRVRFRLWLNMLISHQCPASAISARTAHRSSQAVVSTLNFQDLTAGPQLDLRCQ